MYSVQLPEAQEKILFYIPRFFIIFLWIFILINKDSHASDTLIVVRDAEIENLIHTYTKPLLKASGLKHQKLEILIIKDREFNAFVSGGRLFIHTGAFIKTETPNQIIGVLAHEIGHLAGGHLQRLHLTVDKAQKIAIAGMILGTGSALLAGLANNTTLAQASSGLGIGIGEAGKRGFLAYRRGEEETADQAALLYLEKTQQSASGLIENLKKFQRQLSLSQTGIREDSYLNTHPIPMDRLINLETKAKKSPFFLKKDSSELEQQYNKIRLKIAIYTQGRDVFKRILQTQKDLSVKKYAEVLEDLVFGHDLKKVIKKIDALIYQSPKNPYLQELRGDAFIKAQNPKEAAYSYEKASQISQSALLKRSLGYALFLKGDKDSLKKSIIALKAARALDRTDPTIYRYLSQAFGAIGDSARADLSVANEHYYTGNIEESKIFARRAQSKLKKESPEWSEAEGILNQAERKKT